MVYKNYILYIICILLFVSCSTKKSVFTSKQIVLTIKSKNIKYHDISMMKSSKSSILIDGFLAGTKIFNLSISKNICMNGICLTPELFNTKFLSTKYENDILKNIFTKLPLFAGENMIKHENGFTQTLHTKHYNISYTVTNNNVYFEDKVNRILIKLKEIGEI